MEELEIPLPGGTAVQSRFLDDAGTAWWIERLRERQGITIRTIGQSRGGRVLYGLQIGGGPMHVSITAGAHADEPAGPMATCALAWWLSEPAQANLHNQYTVMICPQVNPDGSEANRAWFRAVPDMELYLRHVKREGPGDDIEFGYPGGGRFALRPENAAVAEFLKTAAPYNLHVSLHSMGFAEGAWFLISSGWAGRTKDLRDELANRAAACGFQLHDIERHGDKGFTRIAKGFCTTPTSTAMREHFLAAGDHAMADRFHYSSMEYVASLGGDPLAIVSELPNFAIGNGWKPGAIVSSVDAPAPAPEPGATLYERCRDAIKECVAAGDLDGAVRVAKEHRMVPVPFAVHAALQVETVTAAMSSALQP